MRKLGLAAAGLTVLLAVALSAIPLLVLTNGGQG